MENAIERFYTAFQKLDAETMASCYDDDVVFEDPAFGKLQGEKARNMWRMLINSQKGKDFTVTFSDIKIDGNKGKAHWEAHYNFSKTGRRVHNNIQASFTLKDGKIVQHTDIFDLHKWASQALGFKGWLLGGTSFFQKKLQTQTNNLLDKFEVKNC